MKKLFTLLAFLLGLVFLSAQEPVSFNVELKEITFSGLPAVQSYA